MIKWKIYEETIIVAINQVISHIWVNDSLMYVLIDTIFPSLEEQ